MRSVRIWAGAALATIAVHGAVIVLLTGGDFEASQTHEETLRALFLKQREQLNAGDYGAVWPTISRPYRGMILGETTSLRFGSFYQAYSALWLDSAVPVNRYPDVDLTKYVQFYWDGEQSLRVEVMGSIGRVAYIADSQWSFHSYSCVKGTWYLDGLPGEMKSLETLRESVSWTSHYYDQPDAAHRDCVPDP